VRLRVPVAHRELWAEMLRLMPAVPLRPEVVGDAEMEVSEAMLETALGRVDLGVRAQIEEIERGFFDLLEVRAKDGRAEEGKQG
jgi:flagellar assembly protein FliH